MVKVTVTKRTPQRKLELVEHCNHLWAQYMTSYFEEVMKTMYPDTATGVDLDRLIALVAE